VQADPKRERKPSKARVGRPTLDEAGAIDEAILAAATRVLLQMGFDGTSMEAVALAAGVSKRTLYLRYGSKDELIRGVVENRVASWAAAASVRDADAPADFKARLMHHAETLAHALGVSEVRDFARLIQSSASRFPDLAKAFHDIGYRYELEFLTAEISKGTAGDALPVRNAERVAQQLFSMIIGWRHSHELVREIDPAEATEFARDAVELLFSGRESW
jgi:AcrR family transcriptional regulator